MTVNFVPDPVFSQVMIDLAESRVANARAVVPGKAQTVERAEAGERDVEFLPGIARRQAGELVADGPVPRAPVLVLGGGGWATSFPFEQGDEGIGLVVDRNSQRWRQNREVGDAHSFDRAHDLSDTFVLPMSITPAAGAPSDPAGDWVLSNTEGGERLRLSRETGQITLTKPSLSGTPAATITMGADGSVTIEVAAGQSVNIGGPAALPLTKWSALSSAMTAMFAAGASAGTGPPGTTGKLAFEAAEIAWDLATGASSPEAQKAKGE